MSSKDLFDKPFDEGTIAKLQIFEKYFDNWLPTFVMGPISKPIQIFDLFAGIGYDINQIAGSPIRILEIIHKHRGIIVKNKKRIHLFFNDLNINKKEKLEKNVNIKIKELALDSIVEINYSSKSFKDCLEDYDKELKYGCNLIFIDQNGFKEVDELTISILN